ncbi:MAG: transporter substrate-binding domain-containing protein [Anaerolineales bacterium]|nr:MAG: transporter substrate-binding domain-containing protein [Anaerolineales bacterium]
MDPSTPPEQPPEDPDMSGDFTSSEQPAEDRGMTSDFPSPEQPSPSEPESEKGKTWLYVLFGVAAVLLIAVIAFALFGSCSTPPPDAGDDSWAKIEAAGVMNVGTAADYAPFEYYNEQLVMDGFDIALIREVANVLGVSAEVTDFAFQGLGGALQIGQVDLLISALSITDEREAIADFSNVYFVGEDGVLAREGSDIDSISSPSDFSGKRVGVQNNTVYMDWAQSTLVASGIITQDQLFVYAKPEHAVADLMIDRLDLVVMDFLPAKKTASETGVNLVGQSLNLQHFAIAVPQGASALQQQINSALTELQNNGTMARLYKRYLNLKPDEIPTPSPPEATATPAPTPTPGGCINGMEFVDDLSYDDHDFTDLPKLNPGEQFAKGWRIKNSGTCEWTMDYYLGFVRGDRMDGKDTNVDSKVETGQTLDIYVDLVAPNTAGEFTGWWQMFTDKDIAFGETIWVAIQVIGPTEVPTNTPEATETPIPPEATDVPPEPTATEHPAADLIGPTWVLKEYTPLDGLVTEALDDPESTVIFDLNDMVSGSGGCNTYSGTFLSDGEIIDIEIESVTKLVCEQPIMDQELMFLQLLDEVEEYLIQITADGSELEVLAERTIDDELEDVVIMVFETE